MKKLHKKEADRVLYWQAWEDDGAIVVQTGVVGAAATATTRAIGPDQSIDDEIARLVADQHAQGYREFGADMRSSVVVQYRIDGWGTAESYEKRNRVAAIIDAYLRATGNGACDGGDMGRGTMNVFSYVIVLPIAWRGIRDVLDQHDLLDGAVMAIRLPDDDDAFDVCYPFDYEDAFRLW